MFDGLALMNAEELAEITRLIGIDKPPSSPDVLHDIVSGWLARAVKKEGKSRSDVERAVLEWTANAFRISFDDGVDTNDLERLIRRRIADDAAAYLDSSWTITCALVAVGKADNIGRKLTLLEQAASMAVPSQAALRKHRAHWEELCRRWSAVDPMPELHEPIRQVAERSELGVECLTLGLALSLLDGGISFPTERLFRDVAAEFGLDRGQSDQLQKRVNNLYWKHHNANQPTGTQAGGYADPVGTATRLTVYEAGALEALATDARVRLFSTLEPEPKKTGWSRLMGSLSGMSPFFSDKMKDGAQATLARVVYHTIVKQHVTVAADAAEQAAITKQQTERKTDLIAAAHEVSAGGEPQRAAMAGEPQQAAMPGAVSPVGHPAGMVATPQTPAPDSSALAVTAAQDVELPDVEPAAPLAETVQQPAVKRTIKLDF